jgi:methionine biosynthesis protein MetW
VSGRPTSRATPRAGAAATGRRAARAASRVAGALKEEDVRALLAHFEAERRRTTRRGAAGAELRRWQDRIIEREIPRGASVLDLGCGNGELLHTLCRLRGVRGQGLELDAAAVMECVERGVPVLQADLDEGLKGFSDNDFDYVVLEETLQTLHRPLRVLREMLRVGRHGIVSFPNFACWQVRWGLALEGRMPVTGRLPYRWHDTPNIHLFTLQDFLDWTKDEGVRVVKAFAFAEGRARPLRPGDNLVAEEALFFVAR